MAITRINPQPVKLYSAISAIYFNTEATADWIDIRIDVPSDTQYPTRCLSFSNGAIEYQKRNANFEWSSRVVLWRK